MAEETKLPVTGETDEDFAARTRVSDFAANREKLYSSASEFASCIRFLVQCREPRNSSERRSSYGLKHVVENHCEIYISNGALIAAVIALGLRYERQGCNVLVCIEVPPALKA